MTASHPLAQLSDHARPALAERALSRSVYRFVSMALMRYHLPPADRDDLAQEASLKVHIRGATYDAKRGKWEQWLSGIVRNEVRMLRRRARRRWQLWADEPSDVACMNPSPEERLSRQQLAHLANQMWQFVPPEERRVVILHEFEGLTFRQIAEREEIAHSTAEARYERGMAKLRRADEEAACGVPFPLPASALAYLGADEDESGPPPELFERTWQALVPILGVEQPHEAEPPPSGPGLREPSQRHHRGPTASRRPPRRGLRALLVVGPTVGILLAACPVSESGEQTHQAPRAAVATAAEAGPESITAHPPVAAASDAHLVEPATAAAGSPVAVAPPVRISKRTAPPIGETVLIDRARTALWAQDVPTAAQAVADHIRLYPRGQHLALRERMRVRLCAGQHQFPELARLCLMRPSH